MIGGAKKLGSLGILATVFLAVGPIGVPLNFGSPNWNTIGVDPKALKHNINEFPNKYCPESARPVCSWLSGNVEWFLGL